MSGCQIKAYAKINLGLDVAGRLPNGYHQVKMIMQSVGICDVLTLEKAERGITVTTDSPELPTGEDNLVYKAARLMLDQCGIQSGVHIHLHKTIPIAAGMAGGSTDAAAAMKGIRSLYALDVPLERLMEYGVRIGADVPYCLLGGTALAEGIGERLTSLPPLPDCHILVAKPAFAVSTKFVYEHLDAKGITAHPDIDGMTASVRAGDLEGVVTRMANVLETVTVPAYPVIDTLRRRMLALGASGSLMSGSGPTVFGIFPQASLAESAYMALKNELSTKMSPGGAFSAKNPPSDELPGQEGLVQLFLTTPVSSAGEPVTL